MSFVLSTLFGGWQKWAAIGTVAVAAVVYVVWLRWSVEQLESKNALLATELVVATAVAETNAATAKKIEADSRRALAASAAAGRKAIAALEKRLKAQEEISRVPESENCVLGPASRAAVERVWGLAEDVDPRRNGREALP